MSCKSAHHVGLDKLEVAVNNGRGCCIGLEANHDALLLLCLVLLPQRNMVWTNEMSSSHEAQGAKGLARSFQTSKLSRQRTSKRRVTSHADVLDHNSRKKSATTAQGLPTAGVSHVQQPATPSLSTEALVKLRHFLLRSPRAVAKLRLVDIVGEQDPDGVTQEPAVRKGRIRASLGIDGDRVGMAPCNLIDAFPFERCEVVATVVKQKVLYTTTRQLVLHRDNEGRIDEKGKQPATEEEQIRDVVSLIIYERELCT